MGRLRDEPQPGARARAPPRRLRARDRCGRSARDRCGVGPGCARRAGLLRAPAPRGFGVRILEPEAVASRPAVALARRAARVSGARTGPRAAAEARRIARAELSRRRTQ